MGFSGRHCFTVARFTGVLLLLLLLVLVQEVACSFNDSEFVMVPSSKYCIMEQDCILNCKFNSTAAGGWDKRSAVNWTRADTGVLIHSYYDNRDQLANQHPLYANRTSLFGSELLQRGNASLLLRAAGLEQDHGMYECRVHAPKMSGSGLIEVSLFFVCHGNRVGSFSFLCLVLFLACVLVLSAFTGLYQCWKCGVCCWKKSIPDDAAQRVLYNPEQDI